MSHPIEAVFYIHGVSNHPNGRPHVEEYSALHRGIGHFTEYAKGWPEDFDGAEWGWNYTGGNPHGHELLTQAQRLLGGRAMPAVRDPWDITVNPARPVVDGFRELFLYGFGDIFYYVSETGKQAVRQAVAEQFMAYMKQKLREDHGRPISLTLIGHSAGSVIAFDLLFYLFQENAPEHEFLPPTGAFQDTKSELARLRELAQQGRLRIRRLITFGSPITPLAFRTNAVLEILAADRQLDPGDYGLTANPEAFGAPLQGPRWLNLWDKDDPIAWPVEPLMEQTGLNRPVEDLYVDVSDLVSSAHNEYWRSTDVHREIANRW
jgi:hypothetical protein